MRYQLVGVDGEFYQSATKGLLGGHRKNKLHGKLDCRSAARWIAKGLYVTERVFFADEHTAIAAGYRPCALRLPEAYRNWKINQTSSTETSNRELNDQKNVT